MTKTQSMLAALFCTFIWGTTFIAQDTGMDDIGPFTFNSVRVFVGFLAILPFAFYFEYGKAKLELSLDLKTFSFFSFFCFCPVTFCLCCCANQVHYSNDGVC